MVLCDLDHFKSLNDRFGHPFGDEVLERAASILNEGRGSDVACRYGGEEFGLILPGTSAEDAMETVDRHRERIAQLVWPDRVGLGITASFGVADLSSIPVPPSSESLISVADEALYKAKSEGRNKVVIAPTSFEVRRAS